MNDTLKGELLTAALAVALVGLTAFGAISVASPALAEEEDEPLLEETVEVTNDTEAIRSLAMNTTGTLDVSIYEGTNTSAESVASHTLDAAEDEEDIWDYYEIEPAEHDQYTVVIEGDGAETLEVSKLEVVSTGGAFSLDDDNTMYLAGGLLVVVVAGGVYWRNQQNGGY